MAACLGAPQWWRSGRLFTHTDVPQAATVPSPSLPPRPSRSPSPCVLQNATAPAGLIFTTTSPRSPLLNSLVTDAWAAQSDGGLPGLPSGSSSPLAGQHGLLAPGNRQPRVEYATSPEVFRGEARIRNLKNELQASRNRLDAEVQVGGPMSSP